MATFIIEKTESKFFFVHADSLADALHKANWGDGREIENYARVELGASVTEAPEDVYFPGK